MDREQRASLRARLHADAVDEALANCHHDLAAELSAFCRRAVWQWRQTPDGAFARPPSPSLMFASLAEVLADLLDGISATHLSAHAADMREVDQ